MRMPMSSRCWAALLGALLAAGPAGAAGLSISCPRVAGDSPQYLEPGHPVWSGQEAREVLLNVTPRVYKTDPAPELPAPSARVRAVHTEGDVLVFLEWEDPTPDSEAPAREPAPELTKEGMAHAESVERFADAAACQVPERPAEIYPSVMMGSEEQPVRIAFWKAGLGVSSLRGKGRARVEPDRDLAFEAEGRRTEGGWQVVFRLPLDRRFGRVVPVSFAVWDGARQQRNGRKYFSVWYDLELQ